MFFRVWGLGLVVIDFSKQVLRVGGCGHVY